MDNRQRFADGLKQHLLGFMINFTTNEPETELFSFLLSFLINPLFERCGNAASLNKANGKGSFIGFRQPISSVLSKISKIATIRQLLFLHSIFTLKSWPVVLPQRLVSFRVFVCHSGVFLSKLLTDSTFTMSADK